MSLLSQPNDFLVDVDIHNATFNIYVKVQTERCRYNTGESHSTTAVLHPDERECKSSR